MIAFVVVMLKVACESCKAPYQVDERRIPESGLKMRCPKCTHTFIVTSPSKGVAVSAAPSVADEAPALPIISSKRTIPGIEVSAFLPSAAIRPSYAPAPTQPEITAIDPTEAAIEIEIEKSRSLPPTLPAASAPSVSRTRSNAGVNPAPDPATLPVLVPLHDSNLPSRASGTKSDADAPTTRKSPRSFGDVEVASRRSPRSFGDAEVPALPSPRKSPRSFGDMEVASRRSPRSFGDAPLPDLHPLSGAPLLTNVDLPALPTLPADLPGTSSDLVAATSANAFSEIDLLSMPDFPPAFGANTPNVIGASAPSFAEPIPPARDRADTVPLLLPGEINIDAVIAPLTEMHAAPPAFAETSHPAVLAQPTLQTTALVRYVEKEKKKPIAKRTRILLACAAILVVVGVALQFTSVGAFGYLAMSDKLNAGEYAKTAAAAGDTARKKLAVDTYSEAVAAADELGNLHRRMPRAHSVTAYAAFVEFSNLVRFGSDDQRLAHAQAALATIPQGKNTAYLAAARAARSAATGEWARAKTELAAAAAAEPKNGIQVDIAILRGEVALAEHDAPAAENAFRDALAQGEPSARAEWGLAQAYGLAKDVAKQREALDATQKLSPKHAGARTMHALLTSQLDRDNDAALSELDAILSDALVSRLGTSELSATLTAKGSILFKRDRTSEALAAFNEAVKIDPHNLAAIAGEGQVFYVDGRYAEALSRFDEVVRKEPTNLPATIGRAMTMIALERFGDAKTVLTAARQRAPKDVSVALWLARAEEALGDKARAEELYTSTVDLADPQDPDAIQAHASFASFLAAQGRTNEAATKLEQSRSKADSAALQRAFGDIAVAQGSLEQAIDHYTAALEKTPNDLGTRFRLGSAYQKLNRLDKAAEQFERIAAVDKDYPGLAVERGQIFEKFGNFDRALEQYQSAYNLEPKNVDLQMRLAAALVATGRVKEALPLLEAVRIARPNSAEVNHFIGRAKLKMGGADAAAAVRYLQRAAFLEPNRADYHLYVARAANEANPAQLALARTEVDRALALDKSLADGYWLRGTIQMRQGAISDAISDLRRSLEIKPSRSEVHALLAEAYEQKNDMPTAMGEWAKAVAGDGKVAVWRYRYGRLLLDTGATAEAAKHLLAAVDAGKALEPRPAWLGPAAFSAGEALRKTGQKPEAIAAYNVFLELAAPSATQRRDALRGLEELGAPYTGTR